MRIVAGRIALIGISLAAYLGTAGIASGATLPNFQESVAFSGLTNPTSVEFASDGRVFVAEKSGLIKVFDGLSDQTPSVFADLRTNVYNFWDRGLLGLALHPNFPSTPYVYALYTYDAPIGGSAPFWGSPGAVSDPCPNPPGATSNGCVVSARLSRLQAAGNVMTGPEQVLVEDWCQQFPSHSIGTIAFGPDGALYVSAGDGASFTFVDSGQNGDPCGDPPSDGGALRSQDRVRPGDPVTLDGAILRLDPATGAAMAGNPLGFSADANERRMIATGLRNPFRMAFRPGTSELWLGDVGWDTWEEVNVISNPTDSVVENFGWPCYEGNGSQSGYDAANLQACESLYAQPGAVTAPFWAYNHAANVVAGETCPTGSSSASGMAFYSGGAYPSSYNGALFFADYSRDCIWAMLPGATGRPNPANLVTFVAGAANPVELQIGPGGDLFYVDFDGGAIRRITHSGSQPPQGRLVAAYGFDEASGTTVADASTGGNTGTISGASRSAAGRFGGALSFDGVNDWVTVADSPSLDLSAGMTLEAWLHPLGATTGWRTALIKEQPGSYVYALYSSDGANTPGGFIFFNWTDIVASAASPLPAGAWTHVAATYDGATLRFYLNGTQVSSRAFAGSIPTSTGPLRIGGTASFSEWFSGRIDEVRVYDGPLTAAQIQADMTTPIAAPPSTDTSPPSVPGGLSANLAGSTANLSWNASTDNVGVTGYNVHRSTTSGFVPSAANRIAQPTASSYADAGLSAGTYYYVVTAQDAIGNVSGPSSQATVTVPPNAAPTPTIQTPLPSTTWRVGQSISFSGSASDPEQGTLPASALSWSLILHHCPSNCHTHPLQDFPSVAGGSFAAPDHDYPSHLELRLTATDARGLTGVTSVQLQPQTVGLSFASDPAGLQLVFGSSSQPAPFTRNVIVGSQNSVSAASPQSLSGTSYVFSSWSDGGAQSHTLVAPAAAATYTARFAVQPAPATGPVAAYGFNETTGSTVTDASGRGNTGTILGATRTTAGRFGRALSFDGLNDWVRVLDSASLDLVGAMTLEAWVRPTVSSGWRTVLLKEQPSSYTYALYSSDGSNRPGGYLFFNWQDMIAGGPSALPTSIWTHLATTYDGATLRLYVNGTQVGSRPLATSIVTSAGALGIGGSSVFGEYFAGRIDELRIYDRALSAAEVVADRDRAVSSTSPFSLGASSAPAPVGARSAQLL